MRPKLPSRAVCLYKGNILKPVGFYSKLLSLLDINRSAFIKESYAFIYSLQHFRNLITNSKYPVTVYTDAKSIINLARKKTLDVSATACTNKLLDLASRLDINVYHIPGKINYMADQLSRSFLNSRYRRGEWSYDKTQASFLPPLPRDARIDSKLLRDLLTSHSPEQINRQIGRAHV